MLIHDVDADVPDSQLPVQESAGVLGKGLCIISKPC